MSKKKLKIRLDGFIISPQLFTPEPTDDLKGLH